MGGERGVGLVKQDDGWRLPDELWAKMQPLLPPRPPHPLGCHNPRVDDRRAMDAILLVLRTGMQWHALKATGLCHPSSAYRRFREWAAAGVFREFWRQGLLAYEAVTGVHWKWLALDGAMSKAPLGGQKTGPNPTDRAKRGTKKSLLTDGRGVPLGHRRGQPHQALPSGGRKKARRWVVERTHTWIQQIPPSAGALGEA